MNMVEVEAHGRNGRKRKNWKKNGSGSSAGKFWEFAGSESRDFSRYEIFSTSSPFRGRVYIWGHLLRWENFPWSPLRGMKFFPGTGWYWENFFLELIPAIKNFIGSWFLLSKIFIGADSIRESFFREPVPGGKNFFWSLLLPEKILVRSWLDRTKIRF